MIESIFSGKTGHDDGLVEAEAIPWASRPTPQSQTSAFHTSPCCVTPENEIVSL